MAAMAVSQSLTSKEFSVESGGLMGGFGNRDDRLQWIEKNWKKQF